VISGDNSVFDESTQFMASTFQTVSSDPAGTNLRWYVAQTLPRREFLAIANLGLQSFVTFWPRFWKARRRGRKTDTSLAPLFPGYIFVQLDIDQNPWRTINGTFGVRQLVIGASTYPKAMPCEAMSHILSRCKNGVMNELLESIKPGQITRIISGPLADTLVSIDRLDDGGRVRVLLNILGAQNSISVPREHLGPP